MKRHLNVLSRLQGAGTLPFADELLPLAERATYEALEALSPTRCAGCERSGALICQDCLASLVLIDPCHSCIRCGAPFGDLLCTECSVEGTSSAMAEALDRCLACAVYAHPLPRIIKRTRMRASAAWHRIWRSYSTTPSYMPGGSPRSLRRCAVRRRRGGICARDCGSVSAAWIRPYGSNRALVLRSFGCVVAGRPGQIRSR